MFADTTPTVRETSNQLFTFKKHSWSESDEITHLKQKEFTLSLQPFQMQRQTYFSIAKETIWILFDTMEAENLLISQNQTLYHFQPDILRKIWRENKSLA